MSGIFESPSLSDDLAQSLGRTLDAMLAKDTYAYILIVAPLDLPSETMAVINTLPEIANKILEHALDSEDGKTFELPQVS